ncbi:hypothetical protein HPB50_019392 [Hyalomma asiaticum]|uniref:Uncharacterized protein n=1 Tax=Hyalomma asiaticum TaxID=266040 RepID=A0ACB7SMW9_HYAAI|nr:hypothetical protein HPB50_019392 [Hyalomma asiaticum]
MSSQMLVVAALLCLLRPVTNLEVDKTDGGYKDLLVSISKDVPYNESIVENIKSLLNSSSTFLHVATNGRVYFKSVTIDFPNTWPKRSAARSVSSSSFEKSDVRVDVPGSSAEERPFTRQSRPCGKPGDYIQLTPTFLAELNGTARRTFENPAYVFVHEWAHYRYGVFDEYGSLGDDRYPVTYCEGDKVALNSCSRKIRYIPKLASGEKCKKMKKSTCRFTQDCIIHVPASAKDPVESSIMFMPYVANVSQFCDSDGGRRQHNRFAPNKQNAICRGKSTWEVISQNDDFKSLPRPDMSKRIEVAFKETQQREDMSQRVVLVLDVSNSMKRNERMKFLKEATTRYVQDIEDGSKRLAIITFSTNATVHHPLMSVDADTRQGFLDTIKELKPDRRTCIGCGLQEALEVLTTRDETPEGGIIVLMSDGGENESPKLSDVMPLLTAAKVEVSTLALGAMAEENLEKLATATRGKAFFFEDLKGNTALRMETAFVEATTTQAGADKDYVTFIDAERTFMNKLEENFTLESSLGNNTVVVVERVKPTSGHMTVTLIDPSGQECDKCADHGVDRMKKIVVPSPAQPGVWTIRVDIPGSQEAEVNVQVKSRGKDPNSEPIRVNCRMASLEVRKPDEAIIYADVSKGKKVVLDATVVAEVNGPNPPHKSTVALLDDGKDPDIAADDGTYSGYFVQFTGKGRYTVTAHVSDDRRARVSDRRIASGSFFSTATFGLAPDTLVPDTEAKFEYPIDDFEDEDDGNTTAAVSNHTSSTSEPAGAFQRVAVGGSFQVMEDILQKHVPPSTIIDLKVVDVRPLADDTLAVRVTWTWPGAHLTSGNASSVEIRASKDPAKLDSDFNKQEQMTIADVIEGDLDALPAGREHVVTFRFDTKWATRGPDGALDWKAFLAARVSNSDGLESNTSNVVQVSYTIPAPLTTTLATTTVATTTTTTTGTTTTEATTTQSSITKATTTEATTTEATTTEAATAAKTTKSTTTPAAATTESATTTATTEKELTRGPRAIVSTTVYSHQYPNRTLTLYMEGCLASRRPSVPTGRLEPSFGRSSAVFGES